MTKKLYELIEKMEKNKIKQILNDINYGLDELNHNVDYFVNDENGKTKDIDDELTKEDFVFVIKNKIEELKKLLKMEHKNEK